MQRLLILLPLHNWRHWKRQDGILQLEISISQKMKPSKNGDNENDIIVDNILLQHFIFAIYVILTISILTVNIFRFFSHDKY